ncbi:MAG: alpha/beta hydrolase, partial [Mesorhizobium sp.]
MDHKLPIAPQASRRAFLLGAAAAGIATGLPKRALGQGTAGQESNSSISQEGSKDMSTITTKD